MGAFDFGEQVDPRLFERYGEMPGSINVQRCVRLGWQMFREHTAEFTGFTLVLFVVWLLSAGFDGGSSLLFSAVAASFHAGYAIAAFRLSSGQRLQFSDFFRGFNYFLPLFLASMASSLIVGLGLILLLLPGLYLAVCYLFTTFFIIDYRMNFWQAMETSRALISRNWFSFFGFACVLVALNLLGALAFGIGLLVSVPVTSCAAAIAYKEIVGLSSADW